MVLVFSQTQISNVVKVIISKIPAFPSKLAISSAQSL